MSLVTCHMSISVDGFVAGPDQSLDNPLGIGGPRLHQWHMGEPRNDADRRMAGELMTPKGAYVMGRNMFGPIRGDWAEDWQGWWGEEPPYHAPVFVLTHYPHDPIEMKGGTTFHFVTDGFDAAFAQAQAAAADSGAGAGVDIAGGASTVRQALAAGVINELILDVAPVLLGRGERIFDGSAEPSLEAIEVAASPYATHIRYRVGG
jgi:dihydrofolate reductase